jgi:PhnB protein
MAVQPIPPGPRVIPYLLYEDVAAALEWLERAFGLEEVDERFTDAEGRVTHASMKLGDGIIMMGWPGPTYQNPKRLGQATQQLYVYVEDVDAHFTRARDAGAAILEEPKDQFYGDRRYSAVDPEGHYWSFAQHVRDVAREDMQQPA